MTIRLLATLGVLVAAAPAQETAKAGKVKVEVVGLHVHKAPYKGDKDLGPISGPAPGTKVLVVVAVDDGGLIKLQASKSKLAKFMDDKGTDLLAAKPPKDSYNSDPIGEMPTISKDAKSMVVELQAMTVPSPGAKTLQIEGTLSLAVGKDLEVFKQEKVEAKKDTTFKVGDVTFNIMDAKESDFGDEAMRITLESKDGIRLAKIRFFDSAGKEIESSQLSRSMIGIGTESNYSWAYALKQLVPAVTLEVTLWKKVTVVDVPVKLAVAVGL